MQHYPWFEFEKEVAVDLEDNCQSCFCPEQSLFRDTMFGHYILIVAEMMAVVHHSSHDSILNPNYTSI